jgi:hypothetical protein
MLCNSLCFTRIVQLFSASTHRWNQLNQALPKEGLVVKSLSVTRWSARADAVKAVNNHCSSVLDALQNISRDSKQPMSTRAEAEGLIKQMDRFETALMTVICSTILDHFNATSLALQNPQIDL